MKYKILITEPIHSKANTLLKKETQIIQPISFNCTKFELCLQFT